MHYVSEKIKNLHKYLNNCGPDELSVSAPGDNLRELRPFRAFFQLSDAEDYRRESSHLGHEIDLKLSVVLGTCMV